jgi:hypothetical protein
VFKSLSNPQRKAVANGRHRLSATTPVPCLWHPEAPGPLWDGTRRVGRNQIEAYCRVVAREFKPEKIILFGSHACGKPTKDSDVDLVVICRFAGGGRKRDFKFKCRWTRPFHRTCWCGSRGSFHGCKVSIVKCWSVAK